jgi:phytoene desaturase
MSDFVYRPGLSIFEFANRQSVSALFRPDLFRSFSSHVRKYFKHPQLIRLLEFPVLFLGGKPSRIPALYSLMNYADIKKGTWYPMGGMFKLVEAMESVTRELGVSMRMGESVSRVSVDSDQRVHVHTSGSVENADVVVASADYHFVEQHLLDVSHRTYSEKYWDEKVMSPSCVIFYLGVNKKIPKLLHHNLFFDEDMDAHLASIYDKSAFPEHPLFYTCCPSKTDDTVAPPGNENLFVLIPVAAGNIVTEEVKQRYLEIILKRLEKFCGEKIKGHIVYQRVYTYADFVSDYNSYKGNAYGLANTLSQTAFLRPSIRSKKIRNLYYAGQLTVPGPGVPPSIISGQIVADFIRKNP